MVTTDDGMRDGPQGHGAVRSAGHDLGEERGQLQGVPTDAPAGGHTSPVAQTGPAGDGCDHEGISPMWALRPLALIMAIGAVRVAGGAAEGPGDSGPERDADA